MDDAPFESRSRRKGDRCDLTSKDLRQRILEASLRGDATSRQLAERFLVSVSFVTRLLHLHRSTGSVEPRPPGGGNPAVLSPEDLAWLRELIRQRPDATLEECRQHLGAKCSTMTISRALSQLGLPRKKVEAAGARVVPLPPWSPDLTPIEEMVSKVKGAMRSAAARTKEAVYAAFVSALHDVTLDGIAGWFQHRAAYAMQL